ncbi:MAG TPA: NAD-dependent epimerase/dehydratase family protein [Polyangiaceae bacterium]|nr:NAD-dependent epimerase/dehydratase family protein [Polyangiaceae bacterium]
MNDSADGYTLVTGGAGFIGTNLVQRLAESGQDVVVLDNFSRAGVERNASWLTSLMPRRVRVVHGDVRDANGIASWVRGAGSVFHFAAQVAVTTSLTDPIADFETNARGTLNVLEAIRRHPRPPALVFTSTNKVYGALPHIALVKRPTRYEPGDPAILRAGIAEDQRLDFHSPYGCSKGAADQYVLDYARSFDLPGVVFRMSCIYGPHQCGNEDQGWLAHFVLSALKQLPFTLYGDGLQVRDALYVDDLVDALVAANARAPDLAGRAFNIGGGPNNTTSLVEALDHVSELTGRLPPTEREAERVGDQKYYVSNTGLFEQATGWAPKVTLADGLERLTEWLRENQLRASEQFSARAQTMPDAMNV